MKTTILILGAAIAAFTFTSSATEALLAPRAQDNQPKVVGTSMETPSTTISYVAPGLAVLSPRATDNQSKIVQGVANESNPALTCARAMTASPKAISECASHTTMPGCVTVAPLK